MAVRNFYLRAQIDGRKTELSGGPRNKEGGMHSLFYQRSDGEIKNIASIMCVENDGVLKTKFTFNEDDAVRIKMVGNTVEIITRR